MTKDEALRLALESLEYRGTDSWRKRQPAIVAIKAALEANEFNPDLDTQAVLTEEIQRMAKRIEELEAKGELVALKPCAYESKEKKMCRKCGQVHAEAILDTTPPQRKPLTDDEIKEAVLDDPFGGLALLSMMRDEVMIADVRQSINRITRAIEAAHGIKETT